MTLQKTKTTPSSSDKTVDNNSLYPSGQWAIYILGFGVFALGTGEFVLAGLLPLLSESLKISISVAGQVVTIFAFTCAISAPVLTTMTTTWQRRTVLVTASLLYIAGNAGTALGTTFVHVLIGQVIAAAGVGLFIPNASVTAAALVPPDRRGHAIAIAVTGFTAAVALGAPFGTALGGMLDWRATMWFITGLAVVGIAGILLFVPKKLSTSASAGLSERFRTLADRRVLVILATTLVGFISVYLPYIYIGILFEPATNGDSVQLASLLFTLGVLGTVGNLTSGSLSDRFGGSKVVAFALIWLTISMLILPLTTSNLIAAYGLIAFYAVAAFAITTPQQHRMLSLKPDSADVLLSLNQSILYLAIAISGLIGGIGIEWGNTEFVSYLAAALAVIALGLSELARRLSNSSG